MEEEKVINNKTASLHQEMYIIIIVVRQSS